MSEQHILNQMEHWGYYLVPSEHPYSPGQHILLVAMREIPTEMHFDPEAMRLRVGDAGDAVNWTTVRLRYPLYGVKKVGLGRVIISDRVDKRIEFFIFGGTLESTHSHNETVFDLRSTAPILEITDDLQSFSDQLAFETEVIVAEAQAQWHGNEPGFSRKLGLLEPAQCYMAAVNSILSHYEHTKALRDGFHEFYAALHREKERMAEAGIWSEGLPRLDELLAP